MADFKYLEVYNYVIDKIKNNEFREGDRLPSEASLCIKFGISRRSVRHAYDCLKDSGYVYSQKGSGYYVKVHRSEKNNIAVIISYAQAHMFPDVLSGISSALMDQGYSMQLGITNSQYKLEKKCLDMLNLDNLAGLIVEGTRSALPNPFISTYQKILDRNIPIVFFHNYYRELNVPSVMMDDVGASYKLTNMLIKAGHTNIGGVFKEDEEQGVRRYAGYVRALSDAGLEISDDRIWWFNTTDAELFRNDTYAITNIENLPKCSAFVCFNDLTCQQIYRNLKSEGISVPDDVSLVGFDDEDVELDHGCRLTTAAPPRRKMGEIAAETLCDMIRKGITSLDDNIILAPTPIIERSSIRSPKDS